MIYVTHALTLKWIVDDALGPRVVLVVSEPEGVAHELVVGADGTVRP